MTKQQKLNCSQGFFLRQKFKYFQVFYNKATKIQLFPGFSLKKQHKISHLKVIEQTDLCNASLFLLRSEKSGTAYGWSQEMSLFAKAFQLFVVTVFSASVAHCFIVTQV